MSEVKSVNNFNKYLFIILLIMIIMVNFIPTPYHLLVPGQAIDLSRNIMVENGEKDAKGRFLLTSTNLVKANLLLCIYSFFDKNIDLVNLDEAMIGDIYQEGYMGIMERLMEESQMVSQIVALKKAGYYPEISGKGVIVGKVLENSPAKNKLIAGDVIVKINEKPINTIDEFSNEIKKYNINQIIKIYYLRNNALHSTSIPLIEIPTGNYATEKLGIGVYANTKDLYCNFPLNIRINLEKVKGPSAGLMIALEILNQLTENDLSNGLVIAGTGNLNIDGKVIAVNGIKQKIISAKKQKAEIFLIPKENYHEALKYTQYMKIVPVESFDDAIMKLIKL